MNLRGRTIEPLQRLKPEGKSTKNKPRRRSLRNKALGKDDNKLSSNKTSSKSPLHKESPKETRPRTKRRYSRKARRKTTRVDIFSKPYFPPVEETGIREVIEQFRLLSPEDTHLAIEAFVIYECRACHEFFRALGSYLRHKQSTCTSLVGTTRIHPENKNPFITVEICSLFEGGSNDAEEVVPDSNHRSYPGNCPEKTISSLKGSRLLVPVAARSFEADMKPKINSFQSNSELEEKNTDLPIAEECILPETAAFQIEPQEQEKHFTKCEFISNSFKKNSNKTSNIEKTGVPIIEAQKSTSSSVNKISKPIIIIEDESSNYSLDFIGFDSPKTTENMSIAPRVEKQPIVTCSTLPIKHEYITCDNSSDANPDIIEVSFPAINDDRDIPLISDLSTPKNVPITEKNRSSSTSAKSTSSSVNKISKPNIIIEDESSNCSLDFIGFDSPKATENMSIAPRREGQQIVTCSTLPIKHEYITCDNSSDANTDIIEVSFPAINDDRDIPLTNGLTTPKKVPTTKKNRSSSISASKRRGTQYFMQGIKRDFVCQFCNSCFKRSSDFRYHKRDQHHNVILGFKCPFCNKYFLNLTNLRFHVTNGHNNMSERFGNYCVQHKMLHIMDPRICRI